MNTDHPTAGRTTAIVGGAALAAAMVHLVGLTATSVLIAFAMAVTVCVVTYRSRRAR